MFNYDYYTYENKTEHNLKNINNRRFWIRKNICIIKFNKQSVRY